MLIKKLNEEKNIKNVHNHKGSLSSIINEHSKEITDMANKYVKASELYSKVKQWVDEAELTGKNAEYAKKALDKMSRMNLENLVTYLFNIRLKGEDSNLGSYDAQIKKRKYESIKIFGAKAKKKSTEKSASLNESIEDDFTDITSLADDCGENIFKVSARDIRFRFKKKEDETEFINKLYELNIPYTQTAYGVVISKSAALDESTACRRLKDKNLNESVGGNTMIISPLSGINSDGFNIIINNEAGEEIFKQEYRYGINASYDRKFAKYAENDVEKANKYNWKNTPSLKPYVKDIVDDLCREYNISSDSIEITAGDNIFTGGKVSDKFVADMKSMIFESLSEDIESMNNPNTDMPEPGLGTGLSNAIIALINDEWEAIDGYNSFIATLAAEDVLPEAIDIIKDIANEENLHIGQLQKLLQMISPNVDSIAKGEEEAEEQIQNAETSESE